MSTGAGILGSGADQAAHQERSLSKQYNQPPAMGLDPAKTYSAIFHTDKGDITITLFADKAPITVNNFVFLARDGFYDGTTFHRVIPQFMAQGGDPDGTGRGGPGYKWDDEASALAIPHNGPGILSMANAGRNTNGSQFFITLAATPWLDNKHAIFGEVTEGKDVVDKIGKTRTGAQDRPAKEIKINSVKIEKS